MIGIVFAASMSFLQPSNLQGCDYYQRPACVAPDIPDLQFRAEDRIYVWPPEDNAPPLSSIVYHTQPDVYGTPPANNPQLWVCVLNEETNAADCHTLWEHNVLAACHTERFLWIGDTNTDPNEPQLFFEHFINYWYYRAPMRFLFWEYKHRLSYWPVVYGPNTPPVDVSVYADRVQILHQTDYKGSPLRGMYLIQDSSETPLFKDTFDPWFPGSQEIGAYGGGTGWRPFDGFTASACVSVFSFANHCGTNPGRPECL